MDTEDRAGKLEICDLDIDSQSTLLFADAPKWKASALKRQFSMMIRQAEQAAVTKAVAEMKQVDVEQVQAAREAALEEEREYHAKEAASWDRVAKSCEGKGRKDAMHQADGWAAYHESQEERLQEAIRALEDKP